MKKAHRTFIRDYNTQIHGCRTVIAKTGDTVRRRVLRGVLARTLPVPTLARIFFATEFTRQPSSIRVYPLPQVALLR
jgi:hypothetical protein